MDARPAAPQDRNETGQYNNVHYQRTVELQRRCFLGVTVDDLYRREVEFALRAANVALAPEDAILDLGSGEGLHATHLRRSCNVTVEARELSPVLVEQARRRAGPDGPHFAVGDMFDVARSIAAEQRFRLVTCLGDSFLYTQSEDVVRAAFRSYFDLLLPGGALVFQFRRDRRAHQRKLALLGALPRALAAGTAAAVAAGFLSARLGFVPAIAAAALFGASLALAPAYRRATLRRAIAGSARMDTVREVRTAEGPGGKFGTVVEPGEPLVVVRDTKTGESCYDYSQNLRVDVPPTGTAGVHPSYYVGPPGVVHKRFGRVYRDAQGREHDLGVTLVSLWMTPETFPLIRSWLLDAGFDAVELHEDPVPVSADATTSSYALVARKRR